MEELETTTEFETVTETETITETETATAEQPTTEYTVIQTVPDYIETYINEQSYYNTWFLILLSIVVGVLLVEVFLSKWKF